MVELENLEKSGKTPKHDHYNQHVLDIDVPQDIRIGKIWLYFEENIGLLKLNERLVLSH